MRGDWACASARRRARAPRGRRRGDLGGGERAWRRLAGGVATAQQEALAPTAHERGEATLVTQRHCRRALGAPAADPPLAQKHPDPLDQ